MPIFNFKKESVSVKITTEDTTPMCACRSYLAGVCPTCNPVEVKKEKKPEAPFKGLTDFINNQTLNL